MRLTLFTLSVRGDSASGLSTRLQSMIAKLGGLISPISHQGRMTLVLFFVLIAVASVARGQAKEEIPADLRTVAEKSSYQATCTSEQLEAFLARCDELSANIKRVE